MITTPVSDYAAAVRAALADVPEPDRSELLEDLEDHLAEIAGDSDESLESRLGTTEIYTADLRAAYLEKPSTAPRSPGRLSLRVQAFHARMAQRHPWYETFRRDLRPVWWVARAYLIAYTLWIFSSGGVYHPSPQKVEEWVILALALPISFAIGQQTRNGRLSRALFFIPLGVNLAGIWCAFIFAYGVADDSSPEAWEVSEPDLVNIYPYTKDGKPLKDVLLYDQHGEPVKLDYEFPGYELLPGSDPQLPNLYPLQLCHSDSVVVAGSRIPLCPNAESTSPKFPEVAPTATTVITPQD